MTSIFNPFSLLDPALAEQQIDAALAGGGGGGSDKRITLTADTTLYVATTGNDTTGTGTLAKPWATPQHAIAYAQTALDFSGFAVTIQIGDGTYSSTGRPIGVTGWIGGGTLTIQGNTGDKTAVRLQRTTDGGVASFGSGDVNGTTVQFLQLVGTDTSFNYLVDHFGIGDVSVENVDVGGCYVAFAAENNLARLAVSGEIGVLSVGTAGNLFYATQGAYLFAGGNYTNKLGGPAAAYDFAVISADTGGTVDGPGGSVTGSFTGPKFALFTHGAFRNGNFPATSPNAGSLGDTDGTIADAASWASAYYDSNGPIFRNWVSTFNSTIVGPTVVGSTATFHAGSARHHQHTIAADTTIAFDKWSPVGEVHEIVLELVNPGAHAVTWPSIHWILADGSLSTTFADLHLTLNAAASNFFKFWSRDNGTTVYGIPITS